MKRHAFFLAAALGPAAFAQFATGFEASEGYSASPNGIIITGQNGWYVPISGSNDGYVYTYSGNVLGTAVNSQGGSQFLGCWNDPAGHSATPYARAQHDVTFGTGKVMAVYDFCPNFIGTPPSEDNIGSFSLQPSTTNNYFQTLFHWVDVNNPTSGFILDYGVDTTGGGVSGGFTTFTSPGPLWMGLPLNHWYRSTTIWDTVTNAVLQVSLDDLTTASHIDTQTPTGWYLSGGANNVLGQPTATAIRCFCGGFTAAGNVVGYDNINIGPAVSTETLAPVAQAVSFGKISSGNLASLAADDNNPEVICKFFVPNPQSPFVQTDLTFNTTKSNPTALSLKVKAKWNNAGAYQIQLSQKNFSTNTFDVTLAYTNLGGAYTVYTGTASGTLTNYVSSGTTVGRIQVKQTGPSTALLPCMSFEYANQVVTG